MPSEFTKLHPFFAVLVATDAHLSGLTVKRRAKNIGGGTFERFSTNERHLAEPGMGANAVRLPPFGTAVGVTADLTSTLRLASIPIPCDGGDRRTRTPPHPITLVDTKGGEEGRIALVLGL